MPQQADTRVLVRTAMRGKAEGEEAKIVRVLEHTYLELCRCREKSVLSCGTTDLQPRVCIQIHGHSLESRMGTLNCVVNQQRHVLSVGETVVAFALFV